MTTASAPVQDPKPIDLNAPVGDPMTLRKIMGGQRWKTIVALLPQQMDEARFGALIMSAMQKTPKLFNCTALSILNSIHQAAQLGLEINAATGEAYLIPYGKNAQLVPGYKGLVKLAIQHPEVNTIEARLVYKGEEPTYHVYYGTESRIEHEPNFDVERTPETVIAAYTVAKMNRGGSTFEVMTRKQLDAIWARSKSAHDGPWQTDREEMYRKTVTRRQIKYLPMSSALQQAIELSDEVEGLEDRRTAKSDGAAALNQALAEEGMAMLGEGAAQPIEVKQGEKVPVREETPAEREQRLAEDAALVRENR